MKTGEVAGEKRWNVVEIVIDILISDVLRQIRAGSAMRFQLLRYYSA